MKWFLESCCTSLDELLEAEKRGASRIELCEDLAVGGVTPSYALIEAAVKAVNIPVNVLVRARGGDFHFSEAEVLQMLADIEFCGKAGAAAVVVGALDAEGNVDMPVMERIVAQARSCGLGVTFHRAFDVCAEPLKAFDDIITLGCDRLLTSGHEADAFSGRFLIAELVRRSAGRIKVMAGCGVRPSNIDAIIAASHCPECHASFSFFR